MREIVVFGTGKVGREALPFLEREFHILFWVDNNENKWGDEIEGIEIKSPKEILQQDCDIVITSIKYASEIAEQLQRMGVVSEKIYFCRRFQTNDTYAYEAYPLLEEKVAETGIPLIQYDLLHKKECMVEQKKVLIFCAFFSVYTKQLIENMSQRYKDIEFSLLTNARESEYKISSVFLKHIYYFETMSDLKTILIQLPIYDVMQLLWIEWEWAYFYKIIRARAKTLNLNVGGSDFYRSEIGERNFKKKLILCADNVTAETKITVQEFKEYYENEVNCKMGLLPFGIETLPVINSKNDFDKVQSKRKFHIPVDRIVVTCGHNAGEAHQHMKIIDSLEELRKDVKKQIVCVFPMAYPQDRDSYIDMVRKRLEKSGLDYVILTEFMDFQGMAEYALVSDIMVHVQTTDQLSSTMLEEMYAGSIVIAGKWLPYEALHEMGIYFFDVNTIADLPPLLEDVILNIEKYKNKCKGNRAIVWKHSSWDELAPRWHALWE